MDRRALTRPGAGHRAGALQAGAPALLHVRLDRAPDGGARLRVPELRAGVALCFAERPAGRQPAVLQQVLVHPDVIAGHSQMVEVALGALPAGVRIEALEATPDREHLLQ